MIFRISPLLLLALFCSAALSQELVNPGFVKQILEPTGGSVLRPVAWFYRERHGGPQYSWILSKEDADKGDYLVGMRVQVIAHVQEVLGKSEIEFVEGFMADRRRAVVVSECGEVEQGFFFRRCIETIEPHPFSPVGSFRIRYSVHYRPGLDIVAIVTAGAPTYEWNTYEAVFDAMSAIEIIDMSRFE
jgi:hypothetical protein